MSDLEPKKMKVAELKEELKLRGLEVKGNKQDLVKRLEKAIRGSTGDSADGDTSQDISGGEEANDSMDQQETQESGDDQEEDEEETDAKELEGKDSELSNGVSDKTEEVATAGDDKTEEAGEEEEAEYQVMDSIGDDGDEEEKPDRKRRRSRSPRHRSRRSSSPRRESGDRHRARRSPEHVPIEMESDDWLASKDVLLDRFNSDLNLTIDENGLTASPYTTDGFAFMWAGARSTYGVKTGKVAFEVKVTKHQKVDHLPSDETNPHVVRVGWSTDSTSMQLGEEKLSYGYGGTAKSSTDCKFSDYGQTFSEGDVITAYVEFESDPVVLSFAKNGEDLGSCFEIAASDLDDQALFPHVLTKNCDFEVNYGQKEEPYFPLKEDFTFINAVPEVERIRGSLPPKKKKVPTATLR